MGAAAESLLVVLQYSVIAAVVPAILIGYWRYRTERNKRNLIQRFPLLVPAILFIITANLVVTFLPVPIADYSGVNTRALDSVSDFNVTFTVREPGIAYQSAITVIASDYMSPDERFDIEIQFYRDSALNRTETLNLEAGATADFVESSLSISADVGSYRLVVNSTFYIGPTPQPDNALDFEVVQRLRAGFVDELRNWSNYQLTLNLTVIVLVFAGFCINQTPVFRPKYGKPLYPEGTESEKAE